MYEQVNINTATPEELTRIKHIGVVRAEKIIKRRPFRDIFELSNVLGLGHKRMTQILEQNIITI
jgi:competence ComEA-like helix-hairpin-helix protein